MKYTFLAVLALVCGLLPITVAAQGGIDSFPCIIDQEIALIIFDDEADDFYFRINVYNDSDGGASMYDWDDVGWAPLSIADSQNGVDGCVWLADVGDAPTVPPPTRERTQGLKEMNCSAWSLTS